MKNWVAEGIASDVNVGVYFYHLVRMLLYGFLVVDNFLLTAWYVHCKYIQ